MSEFKLEVGQTFLSTENYYKIILINNDTVFFTSTDDGYKPSYGNVCDMGYNVFLLFVANDGKNLIK